MFKKTLLVITIGSMATYASANSPNAELQPDANNVIDPILRQDSQGFSEFIKDKLSFSIETNYYNWEGKDNNSKGQQTFTPITLNYREDNMDFGVRTAFINSKNETPNREGEVSTWSDTNLSFAYTQPLTQATSIRYNTEWNLPTGRASLGGTQKNAVMDGGLVSQVRFGEGLNTTVGASVVHNFSENALVGLGYGHTWLGAYDPNKYIDGDTLNPGDTDHVTLQAQYGGQRYLLLGGATYTLSDDTEFGHRPYYKKGNRLDTNITGVYAITAKDRVTAGARYSKQDPDTFINRISGNYEKEERNANGDSLYGYAEYARTILPKHTFKVNASYLNIDANSYDFASDYYNAGRKKWTYGVGYDWQATPQTAVKASLKRYEVKDKATLATKKDTDYSGWNGQLGLNVNF